MPKHSPAMEGLGLEHIFERGARVRAISSARVTVRVWVRGWIRIRVRVRERVRVKVKGGGVMSQPQSLG